MAGSYVETYNDKCKFLVEIDDYKDKILFPDDEIDTFFEEREF